MSKKLIPMGHSMASNLVAAERLKPHGTLRNKRQCNCKICGALCAKGEAYKWLIFTEANEEFGAFNHTTHLCAYCNAYWYVYLGYDADQNLVQKYKEELCLI